MVKIGATTRDSTTSTMIKLKVRSNPRTNTPSTQTVTFTRVNSSITNTNKAKTADKITTAFTTKLRLRETELR